MIRVGITGQDGFIGSHLYNYLGLQKNILRIPFKDQYFENADLLTQFAEQCDTIVHLAAVNRLGNPQEIYHINIQLVEKLIQALEKSKKKPHIIFSSSIQEERDSPYGKSKKEGRKLLSNWAKKMGSAFTGMIIPNVFGPFGRPFYNSVISTFSYQLTHEQTPRIEIDATLPLIYINDLIEKIYLAIIEKTYNEAFKIAPQYELSVTEILEKLNLFHEDYFIDNKIPQVDQNIDICLFNTYRSYIEKNHFPIKLNINKDDRGSFVETVRSRGKGQFSFSSTNKEITRGNHFHIRKIERFIVIKGEALIKLRRIGTQEIIHYEISGKEPAMVDMPVWYTHNITNIGSEDLYTLFWINEFFDPDNPDTYFEDV